MIGSNGEATFLLAIKQIRRDAAVRARVEPSEDLANEYAEALQAGATFAPPVVFLDGEDFHLADGFYRVRAHEIAGLQDIQVHIRRGTRRDAILYAAGCNATHGQRRTSADIRYVMRKFLEDPQWSQQPNTWIAAACRVSEGCVRAHRLALKEEAEAKRREANQVGAAAYRVTRPVAYQATRPGVSAEEKVLTHEERMTQIEALAGRLRRLLGDGEAVRPALEIVNRYLALLRDALGWEEEPEVVFDEQLLKGAKALVARMRKLHAELPAARRATKILDSLSATLARAAAA